MTNETEIESKCDAKDTAELLCVKILIDCAEMGERTGHKVADHALCEFLKVLGYSHVANLFDSLYKRY